jgi:hypothetical protein
VLVESGDNPNSDFLPPFGYGSDLSQNLPAQLLRLYCESAELVVTEPQSPVANPFSEHPIFFNQVIDDVVLMLVHPPSHGGLCTPIFSMRHNVGQGAKAIRKQKQAP